MAGCGYCGRSGHSIDTCDLRLEEYGGNCVPHRPDDDATVWVQDLDDETWHASMYREDDIHQCACGARLQCPVGGVKPDSRMATVGIEKCERCQDYLAEDEGETVPDGGEFSRASELRADGGTCTESTNGSLDFELTHYRLGVVDLYLHDWAEGTRLYTPAGKTTSVEEMAAHDGPVILDGRFRQLVQDGTIVAYHPHAGYRDAFGPDDEVQQPAVLLKEVDRR